MVTKVLDNNYTLTYEEVKNKFTGKVFAPRYKKQYELFKNNELVLSNKSLEDEEFLNCLKFVVSKEIYEVVKEIINNWSLFYTIEEEEEIDDTIPNGLYYDMEQYY